MLELRLYRINRIYLTVITFISEVLTRGLDTFIQKGKEAGKPFGEILDEGVEKMVG